jgi:hypothetical protein
MQQMADFLRRVREEEDGHAVLALPGLVAAIGALALACGAAEDISWVAYLGGALVAIGAVAAPLVRHMTIDYEVYGRLEKLEK